MLMYPCMHCFCSYIHVLLFVFFLSQASRYTYRDHLYVLHSDSTGICEWVLNGIVTYQITTPNRSIELCSTVQTNGRNGWDDSKDPYRRQNSSPCKPMRAEHANQHSGRSSWRHLPLLCVLRGPKTKKVRDRAKPPRLPLRQTLKQHCRASQIQ